MAELGRDRDEPVRRGGILDLIGIALLAAAVGWTFVSVSVSGGAAWPVAGLYLVSGGAFVMARLVTGRVRWLVPLVVVVVGGISAVWPAPDLGADRGFGGTLGYSNSSAALYLQVSGAALMLFVLWRSRPAKAAALALAVAFAAVTVLADSQAGTVLILLPAVALIMGNLGAARGAAGLFAGLFALALVASALLGAMYAPDRGGPLDQIVDTALSERRPALWHDALVLMADHPVAGVGPGRFQSESPVARSDQDARWAHNGFLQQGAEGGVPGLALLVLLFLWGFAKMWSDVRPDTVSALGAAALAALGMQACIDYVLHFPVLPIATAALVGVAVARGGRLGSPAREEEGGHARELAPA